MSHLQTTLDNWFGPTICNTDTLNSVKNIQTATGTHNDQIIFQHPPVLQQTTVQSWSKSLPYHAFRYESWGHEFTEKLDDTIRIAVRNISSLPKEGFHNKNDILIQELHVTQADIYCATEVNLAWQNVHDEHTLYERFKGKLEFSKILSANNRDKTYKGTYQPGGCMIMANGKICGRITDSGTEDHILQRWSWLQITGRNNNIVIIATLYRLVMSTGPISTYQQHKAVLLDNNVDECPRKNLMSSLIQQIHKWQQKNYKIIVTGDFNEDVMGEYITNQFAEVGMREIIIDQHGGNAPNTMIKGRHPIDGIFCSNDIIPIQSGYMGFDFGMASDHRLLWVDLDISLLLGTTATPLWKPKARRLQCNDPAIIRSFNQLRSKFMEKHQAKDILDKLQRTICQSDTITWQDAMEQLDNIQTNSILYADKKCRKLKMGNVPWSPDIQQSMTNITYLQRCRLKYINGYNINSRTLHKSFKRSTFTQPIVEKDEIISNLKKEFIRYKELKQKAHSLRFDFLETLAESQTSESNLSKEKIYKQLLSHEMIRHTFRKIKFSIKESRSGVTRVEALNEHGQWTMRTIKDEIEKECIKENIKRLTQASTTPPMQQDQINLLGWTANTTVADQILQDNIVDATGIHPDILQMAPFLSMPETVKALLPIHSTISTDEYKWLWHRSQEHTSCGISGLHFGHFIASSKDAELREMDRWFIETSLNTGYSLKRWKQGIDVMIPKKVDSQRVDKSRTIVLLEPDFNLINKIIGKRVMALAERAGSIAPEQFGSRKSKSAIIHAVNKQITTDILRQDRKNFCLIILDAKACYDRITPMYASFSMKRQGASDNMIKLVFDTIDEMKHYIRTSYGDSDTYYKPIKGQFHGILQGNGAGPTIWALISSTLLDKLRSNGLGVNLETSDGTHICIPAFSFVDDTDLIQQLATDEDVTSPQRVVTEWSSGLRTAGGMIVPEKCSPNCETLLEKQ